MHKSHWIILFGLALFGCGSESGSVGSAFDDQRVVADFADEVVIPTYSLLAERMADLETAVDTLASENSSENFGAAQDAWVKARVLWEQSEAFLFGPVDSFGYDPAMDSWPVNKTDLDAVLASGDDFTKTYVAGLQETQKGFHTVEYLLFGEERSKTEGDLTSRQLEYLGAISAELAEVSAALVQRWTDSVDGQPPYRDIFASAGDSDNTAYRSLPSAAQEILGGMIGICDEVANGKIADPYDAHDPTLVESQFSYNSLSDFQDNIRSVENAYKGAVPLAATSGRGLSAYVAELDPDLDARLTGEIDDAIDAIADIPEPFRDSITTPSAYDSIEAAQAAIRTLQTTLERDVQPLVLR